MTYLVSLGLGLLVGVAYALLGVRSPAPPIVALAGLLGMVAGEQGALMVRQMPAPASLTTTHPATNDVRLGARNTMQEEAQ